MYSLMYNKVRTPSKYLLTFITFMQFPYSASSFPAHVHGAIQGVSVLVTPLCSCVDPLVLNEIGATTEGLATLTAAIGLHSSMDDLVLEQGGVLTEGLPTLAALVGPFPRVDPLVNGELCAHAEGFPTFHTFVGLHPLMNSLVVDEA